MQWSRVKSILIVILLAVDLFLLCSLGLRFYSAWRRSEQTEDNLRMILSQKNVMLGEDFVMPEELTLPQLEIDRDRMAEEQTAIGLLGGMVMGSMSEPGVYESPNGTVRWDDEGRLRAVLHPEQYTQPAEGAVEQRTRELLEEGHITAVEGLTVIVNGMTAEASFPTAGTVVFNRRLTVVWGESGVTIEGVWTFGTPYITRTDAYVTCSPTDSLLAFAQQGRASRIDGITGGFYAVYSAGRFQLTPAWRIETDKGAFYVDSLKKTMI